MTLSVKDLHTLKYIRRYRLIPEGWERRVKELALSGPYVKLTNQGAELTKRGKRLVAGVVTDAPL